MTVSIRSGAPGGGGRLAWARLRGSMPPAAEPGSGATRGSLRRVPIASTQWHAARRNTFAFLVLGLVLAATVAQAAPDASSPPVDLNRATADQLESLPGIGAVKAAAILAVRDSQGGFASLEELEAVRGVGPALVEKLRPFVVLGKTPAGKTKATQR